jgi:hypothetical protein
VTAVRPRQARAVGDPLVQPSVPPVWIGDPLILIYAVRHALTVAGGHVPLFVQQAVEQNAGLLSTTARRAIARDIRARLDDRENPASAGERSVWIAALAALGADA